LWLGANKWWLGAVNAASFFFTSDISMEAVLYQSDQVVVVLLLLL
jgi:hypothetical protein